MSSGICSFEGCEKPRKSPKEELCSGHYRQRLRGAELTPLRILGRTTCEFAGCVRKHAGNGLCSGHRAQLLRGCELTPLRDMKPPVSRTHRDERGYKQCTDCHEFLPEGCFGEHAGARDKLQGNCRQCRSWRQRLSRYGLTFWDYDKLLESQGNGCAVCGEPQEGPYGLCIDHDHGCCPGTKSCGSCVRGLIHRRCNAGLGHFRDDPDLLERAAEYLRQHDKKVKVT